MDRSPDPDAVGTGEAADPTAADQGVEGPVGPFLRRRFIRPILRLLRQGLSPGEVARALALGCSVGISPLVGTTTATATAIAWVFRLNPVATLTANYGVYPLQVALVLPFARLGSALTGWPNLPLQPTELRRLLAEDGFAAVHTLGRTIGNAALAWALCAPFVFVVCSLSFRWLLRRRLRGDGPGAASVEPQEPPHRDDPPPGGSRIATTEEPWPDEPDPS